MILAWLAACGPWIDPGPAPALLAAEPAPLLSRPVEGAPDVYLAAMVRAGSAWDPVGREGLAHLTAQALIGAGAGPLDSSQVERAAWRAGNDFELVVEREWVTLRLRCHREQAEVCAGLFADALTAPRFEESDVARLRDRALSSLTDGMLADEERLGREALEATIYQAHPYGHPPEGRSGVLPLLGAEDLRAFHRSHYLRSTVFVGLAGAVDPALEAALRERLEALPGTMPPELPLLAPERSASRRLVAVDTGTPVTGLWLGAPLDVDRNDPDWTALWVGVQALGAHRSSWGRLYRSLRSDRGLNYGDYAYLEPWVERSGSTAQDQGLLRRQNRLAVWIRPTSLEDGPFALKLAVDELERWKAEGLEPQEFADARAFLRSTLPVLAADPGRRLMYALEARATGTPDLQETLPARLEALTAEEVDDAIRRRVDLSALTVVAVSGEAEAFVAAVAGEAPTPPARPSEEPARAARDAAAAALDLRLEPGRAWVVPAADLFR